MQYRLFDAHCDTLLKLYENRAHLYDNPFEVSFKKLLPYRTPAQVFAVFNEGNLSCADILDHIAYLKTEILNNAHIAAFAKDAKDLEKNALQKKISVLVSIEGLGNTPDLTKEFVPVLYKEGVRIVSLVWNHDNPLCGGIENNHTGLTKSGAQILFEMERLGMILDVSHISECGFWDALAVFSKKVCATHSNAQSVCPHPRNLTDRQFQALCRRGGVAGINLYPKFLTDTGPATVDHAVSHITRFLELGGENCIGLGADFDGVDATPIDMPNCEFVYRLFDRLAALGFDDAIIDKISYQNFANLLQFD